MRTANGLDARLRKAPMLDFALANEFLHHSGDVFDRRVRIDTMLVIEVDHLSIQPFQRIFDRLPDARWRTILCLRAVLQLDAELGSDDHTVSMGA